MSRFADLEDFSEPRPPLCIESNRVEILVGAAVLLVEVLKHVVDELRTCATNRKNEGSARVRDISRGARKEWV